MQWHSQSSAITGQMVGLATCYYKVNFEPGFEYLGLIFAAEAKNCR